MTTRPLRRRIFSKRVLLLLAFPFVLLLLAQIARFSGSWRGAPEAIVLLPTAERLVGFRPDGRWRFVLPLQDGCEPGCERNLRQLHLYRVALGRRSRRVEILGLHPGEMPTERAEALKQNAPSLQLHQPPSQQWSQLQGARRAGGALLVDPRGYLVGELPADADASAVMEDLRLLVR